ncbi:MAG: acyl-CoA dehydrogenase family protein [Actinomycetota bacterium]|nr:acyl-CoA dehydrogenase family protein [Actinomycetota bacterium]MEC9394627.1 acyl-CoA dehydrogenase family protein [Actinomycetota bacterium]MED6328652.1 acyl-CoA dehydrogenase family protein [Actinomycetota bacterium]MEE2957572.1 acyl-CoA dehydrogenase family protein [Actinomycetota bacterium]
MDLNLTEDQETIREVFAAFFDGETGPERARAAEPVGMDAAAWKRLLETGAPGMGVPATAGGGNASLADLAVVAAEAGARIAPVPFVDHAVTARLLAGVAEAGPLDEGILTGTTVVGLGLLPAVDGAARTVPAGAAAHRIVALDGDRLVLDGPVADPSVGHLANHGCLPLAHRDLVGAEVLAQGPDAVAAHARAVDEWRTLTAATLVGIARAATDLGVAYVMEREQFGRPVGSFQAVQHLLADLPGLIDGAHLLSSKAAWAGDSSAAGVIDVDANVVTDFPALAAMALVAAGEAATIATDRSLHVHGGYGFSEEYDVQLYYRRARALAYVLGDPAAECRRLARMFPAPKAGAA